MSESRVLCCPSFIYQNYRAAIGKVKGQRAAAVVIYADTVLLLIQDPAAKLKNIRYN
jgi:hypothetical protein